MKQLQTALEMYFQDNSSYPLPFPVGGWGGVSTVPCHSANGTTSGPNAYISGLTPKYMAQLPVDPAAPGSCNGYLYYSNGVNYKLLANGTPESYPAAGQPFYDPARPIGAWMLCSANPTACNTW
jgi:hypothetical protein